MKCPRCQFDNPPQMQFCGMCGARLDGHPGQAPVTANDTPTDYTPSFLKETVLASTQAVRGERKHVTVLFADIVGFTTIAERMDPEDVHAIVNGLFYIFTEQIHQATGTINQYTGDGVMALFGAPIAYEDHIRSACWAALAIMQQFRQYAKTVVHQYGVDLNIRMGIHSGPVVVGVIGNEWRRDYTAIGDTTNVAARLQTTAQPGSILVSDRVRQGAEKEYVFEDAGRFELKGKSQPVRAFVLKAASVPDESVAGSPSIFVDRKQQLDLLRKKFATVSDGSCKMVAVTGEAGMGKSIIVERFIADLDYQRVLVLRGQGKPYAKTSALLPVLAMMQTIIDSANGSHHENSLAEGGSGGEITRTTDKLRALIGQFENLGVGHLRSTVLGKARRQVLFDAIRALLADAVADRPVVLLMEDIQWVDTASLMLMADIRRRMGHYPVMLIVTGRYGPTDELPCSADQVLALPPLDRSASRRLLSLSLATDRLARRLQDQLLDTAGGNPLFICEIAAALRQGNVLRCGQDRCEIKGSVAELKTPESLQAVLAARLDALSPDLKQLIQWAAVIDNAFSADTMALFIGWPVDRVSTGLEDLNRMGILVDRAKGDMRQFRFRQQMMREVAYNSLLHQDRRRWHQQVAAVSEGLAGKHTRQQAGFLSHHFQRAANWPKAFNYTLEAALAAEQSHSCHDVLANLERSLQILESGQFEYAGLMALDLYLWQGRMQFAVGQLAAAQATFEKMEDESNRLEDFSGRAEAVFRIGWLAFYQHHPDRAITHLEQAVALSRREGIDDVMLKATGFLGFVRAVLGRLDEARPLLDEALRLSLHHGTARARAWSLSHLLRFCSWTGDFDRALALGEELEQLNRKIASPYFSLMHRLVMGQVYGSLGQLDAAQRSLRKGLKQLETSEDGFWRPRYLNTMGWIAAQQGRLTTARHLNRQSTDLALKSGDLESYYNARINLGENHLDGGEVEKARKVLLACWREMTHEQAPYARWRYKTRLLINLARLYKRLDQRAKGLRYARQALSLASQSGARVQQVRALMIKGQLLAASRPTLARTTLSEALKLSQQIHVRPLQDLLKERLAQMEAMQE